MNEPLFDKLREEFRRRYPKAFNGVEDKYDAIKCKTYAKYPFHSERCIFCGHYPKRNPCIQAHAHYKDNSGDPFNVFAHVECLEKVCER